jgi:hypothetical protein
MITQSFKVKDFENEETYEFHLIVENNWLIKRWGEELEMTQKDVESHYNYFMSLWQDYDVTLLEPAQNTPPAS